MTPPSNRQIEQQVRQLAEGLVEAEGLDLVAVLLTTDAGRRVLRVCVDRAGGVSIQDCARVSRLLSPLLDVEDPVPGRYHLEVSSPGIERPLQRCADFARFTGYRARLRLEPGAGPQRISGVLRGLEGEQLLLEREGHTRRIPLSGIERATLILDLEEYRALAGLGPLDAPPAPRAGAGSTQAAMENLDDQ